MKAVLFDLDGTLLPMDQEVFTKGYFKELAIAFAPWKIPIDTLIAAVWKGTGAMIQNDGRCSNDKVFWKCFSAITGVSEAEARPVADQFYQTGFHNAKIFTGENPDAVKAVELAKRNGRKAVLASNPVFPMVGHASRLSWVGLKPEDFELVTSYESESYCKPNPEYYKSVCERIGTPPEDCLMIGNDEEEDMAAAVKAGLSAYLVTDCPVEGRKHDWTGAQGTFADMLKMLEELD